jgi:hypothetical protein
MQNIIQAFEALPDPRRPNARRHNLLDILVIAFTSMLCGAESCVDMAAFGQAKEDVLREFLDLDNGPPSHDTFSRVFRQLDPNAFALCFSTYLEGLAVACKGHVAIDGKAFTLLPSKSGHGRTRFFKDSKSTLEY